MNLLREEECFVADGLKSTAGNPSSTNFSACGHKLTSVGHLEKGGESREKWASLNGTTFSRPQHVCEYNIYIPQIYMVLYPNRRIW